MSAAPVGEFAIEENDLRPIPAAADTAIRQGEGNAYNVEACQFKGKSVDLDGDGRATDLVVTTENACGWGAGLGPIWVVRGTKDTYSMVLSDGGYRLTIEKRKTKGLRDVVVREEAIDHSVKRVWRYDGRKYRKRAG